ncbi:MAG: NUDIX domain-containing protein [Thermodesulfobacteriota bacterium]
MEDTQDSAKNRDAVKDLLLEDYRYRSESLWKNEQGGETRVNLFVGLVTLVVGALVTLGSDKGGVTGESLRHIVVLSLAGLLVLGLITLARMLIRNEHTDECKRGLDRIRQWFRDHLDPDGLLDHYYPVQVPEKPDKRRKGPWQRYRRQIQPRKFGGLAHTVSAINSLLVAGIAWAACHPFGETTGAASGGIPYASMLSAFIAALAAQIAWVSYREAQAKKKARATDITHAGGVVCRLENGVVKYLLVHARNNPCLWVLPKGHVEGGETQGEAALREVREESGVFAHLVGLVKQVEYRAGDEDVRVKFYLMECIEEGRPKEDRNPEWFSLEEALERIQYPESRFVLRAAERKRVAERSPGS